MVLMVVDPPPKVGDLEEPENEDSCDEEEDSVERYTQRLARELLAKLDADEVKNLLKSSRINTKLEN